MRAHFDLLMSDKKRVAFCWLLDGFHDPLDDDLRAVSIKMGSLQQIEPCYESNNVQVIFTLSSREFMSRDPGVPDKHLG